MPITTATKAKINVVPASELRSQPINATHRQEFVIEFTKIIFLPRLLACVPKDIGNFMEDLDAQKKMLIDSFPLLSKPEVRDVYGTRYSLHNVLQFQHNVYHAVTRSIDTYNMDQQIFGGTVRGDNIQGMMNSFQNELRRELKARLPNVQSSEEYTQELHKDYNSNDPDIKDRASIWLPYRVDSLRDLVTEKKNQKADGTIIRTPIIKSQFLDVIPKGVQKNILKWVKAGLKELGTAKLQNEVNTMYTFSKELYDGIKCVRNTKQFQERYPDMFDEFCAITGLGNCSGQDLICSTDMGTVSSILSEYKKK